MFVDAELYVSRFACRGASYPSSHVHALPAGAVPEDASLSERHCMLMRAVPGEAAWAGASDAPQPIVGGDAGRSKRGRVELDSGFCVLVKSYGPEAALLLHQVGEVVGVLSFEPDAFVDDPHSSAVVGGRGALAGGLAG
jgi:hypothetical protein